MNTEQLNENTSSTEKEQQKTNSPLLDYSIKTCEERMEYVKKLLERTPPEKLNQKFLENLSNYVINGISKTEKREKQNNN